MTGITEERLTAYEKTYAPGAVPNRLFLHDLIWELLAEVRRLRTENERLLVYVRHYHVASHDGTDRCAECGDDLRADIHLRGVTP